MKRIENPQQAYVAALEALDIIKAIQCAKLRGDLNLNENTINLLGEARLNLNAIAEHLETIRR